MVDSTHIEIWLPKGTKQYDRGPWIARLEDGIYLADRIVFCAPYYTDNRCNKRGQWITLERVRGSDIIWHDVAVDKSKGWTGWVDKGIVENATALNDEHLPPQLRVGPGATTACRGWDACWWEWNGQLRDPSMDAVRWG